MKSRAHDFTARYLQRAAVPVGLPPHLTDHRFRASSENILNKRGVPLPIIRKLMRHSKVETTMTHIETREDEMRTAIRLVGYGKEGRWNLVRHGGPPGGSSHHSSVLYSAAIACFPSTNSPSYSTFPPGSRRTP